MRNPNRILAALFLAGASVSAGACGGHETSANTAGGDVVASPNPAATAAPSTAGPVAAPAPAPHHSELAGAAVGAVAGHALGGHAVLGAAAGAIIQHHRNKHP